MGLGPLSKSKLLFVFSLATFMAVIQSFLVPQLNLFAYSPFLGLLCMQVPFSPALWLAAGAGTFFDLLVSDPPGLHALNCALLCALLHRMNRLFKEQPLQLPLYTALVALVSFPLSAAILFLLDRQVEGTFTLLGLIEAPLLNGAYAFLWFVGPLAFWDWGTRKMLFRKARRQGTESYTQY